jgi:hypothetical protein
MFELHIARVSLMILFLWQNMNMYLVFRLPLVEMYVVA